jgi:hypothetical protein
MFAGMCTGTYTQSLLKQVYASQGKYDLTCSFVFNESLIQRGRNALVHQFLKTDCTHLMFIDADIGWEPQYIEQMLDANVPVLAGMYPKKEINWHMLENAVKAGVPTDQLKYWTGNHVVNLLDGVTEAVAEAGKPFPVKYCGTGFMLIQRSVFDDLATFVSEYSNDVADLAGNIGQQEKIREYFTVEVVGQQLLSEDYGFCKLCNDLTIPIHVAPWVQLTHTGTFCFEGRLPSGE